MPKDLEKKDTEWSLTLKQTNKINHRPIYLHLCIEMYSSKIGKLHIKLCQGKRDYWNGMSLLLYIVCTVSILDNKSIFMFYLDKMKLFNLLPQR